MKRPTDERGMTVVELAVVMGIMSVVLVAVLGVMETHVKVERRAMRSLSNQEELGWALNTVARDVRAANPLLAQASVADYANRLDLRLIEPGSATTSSLRWELDATSGELTRRLLSSSGEPTSTVTYRLSGVRNADPTVGVPLFRYFTPAGIELTSANATPADIANCAVRVQIAIIAHPGGGDAVTAETAVELRNRLPGGIGC